jgi:hypothetical protein
VDTRLANLHRANARGDRPLGQVAVADHLPMAAGILKVAMRFNPLGNFGFDGRRQHLLRPFAKNLRKHISARGWKG